MSRARVGHDAKVYVGYAWLEARLHKVLDPAWMDAGVALKGFWTNVTKTPTAPAKAVDHL